MHLSKGGGWWSSLGGATSPVLKDLPRAKGRDGVPRRPSVHVAIARQACALRGRPRERQEPVDSDRNAAAAAPRPRVRRWLDQPPLRAPSTAGGVSGAMQSLQRRRSAAVDVSGGCDGEFCEHHAAGRQGRGWKGLWRGSMAKRYPCHPKQGILLMCSDMYKAGVMASLPAAASATVSSIAGGLAGITAVSSPTRSSSCARAWRTASSDVCSPCNSVWSTLTAVLATGGALSLYAGISMTLRCLAPGHQVRYLRRWVAHAPRVTHHWPCSYRSCFFHRLLSDLLVLPCLRS